MKVAPDCDLLGVMAQTGIGSKLFAAFIPELVQMIIAIEALAGSNAPEVLENKRRAVSRAFLLARGVRGVSGVPWVLNYTLQHLASFMAETAGDFHSSFALPMFVAVGKESAEKHSGIHNPFGHREKRHTFYSGKYFLEALATMQGAIAFINVAESLCLECGLILEGQSLAPTFVLSTLSKIEGKLVLSVRRKKDNSVQFTTPKEYNAMEFARILQSWGVYSGRVSEPPLTKSVWDEFTRRQTGKGTQDSQWWSDWGLGGAAELN